MSATQAEQATSRGRIRIESGQKRVRAYLGGEVVADTIRPVLVWEIPSNPAYAGWRHRPLAQPRGRDDLHRDRRGQERRRRRVAL